MARVRGHGARVLAATVGAVLMVSATPILLGVPAFAGSDDTVYSTDFSDPAAVAPEWRFKDGATSETFDDFALTMTPGAYTVSLDGAKSVWTSPRAGRLPNDQVVEATIAETAGDASLIAGVVCRGSLDDDKGYGFFIGLDGYYSIGTFAPSGSRLVANPSGTKRTDAVNPEGPNTVRARCTSVGKKKVRLTMFVNDEKVASAVDRTAPSRIGADAYLITEVLDGKTASVSFASFSIAAG